MTEQAAQEPTMEEILASIRRIISEDEPAADTDAPEAHAEPEPVPALALAEPEPEPEPEDVLELTERVPEPEAVETHGDLDILPTAPAAPAPAPAPVMAAAPEPADETPLVSAPTAEATSFAFGHLSRSIRMPADGATLEGVVRELLRPLLQAWLDENLPGIVQNAVAEEVERLSRRRV